MSNNREFSQLASNIEVNENSNFIGIATGGNYSVGIGTTITSYKLYVVGDTFISGILTANRIFSSIYGEFLGGSISGSNIVGSALSISGISTLGTVQISSGIVTATSGVVTYYGDGSKLTNISYASNAGIATNLKGGLVGNIPYQSAADTTTFLVNGTSGYILQSNGVGNVPSWVPAAPADALVGLTVRDEGTIVGSANSVSQLNFVGSIITASASAGIATITISNNIVGSALSISGISTLGTVQISSGIVTATSGVVTYYGDGSKLSGVSGASVTVTDDTSTNATYYVGIANTTTGTLSTLNVSSTKLTFNPSTGNLVAGGTVTANSDRKLKTDVHTIENALDKVLSLRGVEFTRIDNGDKQIGVIAQEVEEIIPEVVYPKQSVQNDETKSVAYGNIVGLLIEAIKEQNKEIQELKRRLEEG